jgi:hypothetical protein
LEDDGKSKEDLDANIGFIGLAGQYSNSTACDAKSKKVRRTAAGESRRKNPRQPVYISQNSNYHYRAPRVEDELEDKDWLQVECDDELATPTNWQQFLEPAPQPGYEFRVNYLVESSPEWDSDCSREITSDRYHTEPPPLKPSSYERPSPARPTMVAET